MTKSIKKSITTIIMAAMITSMAIPMASAVELRDDSKSVVIDVNCTKKGYTFEIFQVADLTDSSTPFKTSYNPFIDELSEVIKSGETKDILSALDNMDSKILRENAVSYGTFNSTEMQEYKFDELEQGIYYIKCVGYPAGVKRVENSVVALPYYNNGWNYSIDTIELATKVQDDTPKTEKEITNSTRNNRNFTDVSIGDEVDFKLTNTTAGSTSMKLTTYDVKDDMAKGLTLNNNSFKVYTADKDGNKIDELNNSEYTLNITQQAAGQNTLFDISLNESYLAQDDFYSDTTVYLVVEYSAILNEFAVVGTKGNINEDIELEYGNDSTVDSVPGNEVKVYTWGASVTKLNEDNEKLAGATFAIYKTEADADKAENELGKGTSDDNGKVTFLNASGKELKLESGNYFIREISAPVGYNLYNKVIPISIDVSYSDTQINETYVTNSPVDGYASCTVTDSKLVVPKTGGHVQYFYIVGATLIVAGASILVLSRKKKAN